VAATKVQQWLVFGLPEKGTLTGMNVSSVFRKLIVGGTVCVVLLARERPILCQTPSRNSEIIWSGKWKFFKQENPPLDYVVIERPFVVRQVKGTIRSENNAISGATLEVGLPSGEVTGCYTGEDGAFYFPSRSHPLLGLFEWKEGTFPVRPGTYRFKATKDGFHSTVGTVVVSSKAPKESVMNIELKPGR
jgi:hypothetical protein